MTKPLSPAAERFEALVDRSGWANPLYPTRRYGGRREVAPLLAAYRAMKEATK